MPHVIKLKIYDPGDGTVRTEAQGLAKKIRTTPRGVEITFPDELDAGLPDKFVPEVGGQTPDLPKFNVTTPAFQDSTTPAFPPGPQAPASFVAGAAFGRRQPIRDRIRAGLIRAVKERAPGTDDDTVSEAIDEATGDRPLLDWLANGGLEKLIELIVSLLKLAA